MKVIQVNKLYYPHTGGMEKHVQDLAEALKDDVDLKVLAANTRFASVRELINGVEVIKVASVGRLRSAPLAPSFPLWLRRLRADIWHFHFPYPIGEMAYLLARPGGKLVITYQSDIVRQKTLLALYRPWLRRFLHRADAILASSPNLIDHSSFLQSVRDKCHVIPLGIDLDNFRLTPRVKAKAADLRRRYGPNLILFVGRLIYYKGLNYLVSAMRDVDGHLLIVGEGKLQGDLERQAREAGVREKISFYGPASDTDLPALYHACDLLVLPSIAASEAFGLVQLEAHACGKPVVSTRLPTGVPYANLDGETGLIVPPADTVALAGALNRLLASGDLRAKLGSQAKARVEASFSRRAMADAVLSIYRQLLAED